MTTLREHIISVSDQIACAQCGNCCPPNCVHKTAESTCDIHPCVSNGLETREVQCWLLTPGELVTFYNFRCAAGLKAIAGYSGDMQMTPTDSRFCDKSELAKILEKEFTE